MSKAFVKEDANLEFDGAADDGDDDAPSAAFRVLLTPDGHARLKDELKTKTTGIPKMTMRTQTP